MLYFEESCVPWKEPGPCQGHALTRSEPLRGHSSKRKEGGLHQGKKKAQGHLAERLTNMSRGEMKAVEPVPLAQGGKNDGDQPSEPRTVPSVPIPFCQNTL